MIKNKLFFILLFIFIIQGLIMADEYFVKLYKIDNNKLLYWEAWNNKNNYTIHWGIVGTKGETKEIIKTFFNSPKNNVIEEEKDFRNKGYAEITDLKTIIIQYKIDEFGTNDDLNKRYEIEEFMNNELGWYGLGYCDGGDIGSGTMNIFCLVVDIEIAVKTIKELLINNKMIEGAFIIEESDELIVHYPENYKGKISY